MTREKPRSIFISYRRMLSLRQARYLYLMLDARFPGEVFQEEESIGSGEEFNDRIARDIRGAKVVISLIPPDWVYHPSNKAFLEKRPQDLERHSQLHYDEKCPVRNEIETALVAGVRIIPVLIDVAVGASVAVRYNISPHFHIDFNGFRPARSVE